MNAYDKATNIYPHVRKTFIKRASSIVRSSQTGRRESQKQDQSVAAARQINEAKIDIISKEIDEPIPSTGIMPKLKRSLSQTRPLNPKREDECYV